MRDNRVIESAGPFDIQHSMDFTASPFEALVARRYRRAYIFNQRNLATQSNRLALNMKYRLATRVIAYSSAAGNVLPSSNKVTVVHPGLHIETPQGLSRAPDQVLVVGGLWSLKGQHVAIEAMRLLPSVSLWIVGAATDADYARELRDMIARYGLEDRVEMLGERSDVLGLMCRSSALIICSSSEAMPTVAAEAMLCETPVIAPRIPGVTEIVHDRLTGFLYTPGDVRRLASLIEEVLASRPKEIVESAKRYVQETFSADRFAKEVGEIYREVIRGR